ncbi:Spy0128 family protein [Faecalibacillus intestinalis]|uniref:Spy0128 family protein n=1 Tax=Faecalibacillus intestinalis TaxID=1982626 RepID=UPI0036F41B11
MITLNKHASFPPAAPAQATVTKNLEFAEAKGNETDGVYNVEKTSKLNFATAFPHAGLYEYNVKETQCTDKGMTYSTKEYRLRVYVANNTDSLHTLNL